MAKVLRKDIASVALSRSVSARANARREEGAVQGPKAGGPRTASTARLSLQQMLHFRPALIGRLIGMGVDLSEPPDVAAAAAALDGAAGASSGSGSGSGGGGGGTRAYGRTTRVMGQIQAGAHQPYHAYQSQLPDVEPDSEQLEQEGQPGAQAGAHQAAGSTSTDGGGGGGGLSPAAARKLMAAGRKSEAMLDHRSYERLKALLQVRVRGGVRSLFWAWRARVGVLTGRQSPVPQIQAVSAIRLLQDWVCASAAYLTC